jgi:hypothetical protein
LDIYWWHSRSLGYIGIYWSRNAFEGVKIMPSSQPENREQTFESKLDEILLQHGAEEGELTHSLKQAIKTLVRDTYYSRSFIKYSVGEEIGLYRITDRVARVGKNTKYRVVCIGCGAPMFRYSNKFKLPHKECPQRQIINPQKEVKDE